MRVEIFTSLIVGTKRNNIKIAKLTKKLVLSWKNAIEQEKGKQIEFFPFWSAHQLHPVKPMNAK